MKRSRQKIEKVPTHTPLSGVAVLGISLGSLGLLFAILYLGARSVTAGLAESLILPSYESRKEIGGLPSERAPQFDLPLASGSRVSSESLSGSPFLLFFWTSWNQDAFDLFRTMDHLSGERGAVLPRIISINSQEDPHRIQGILSRGGYRLDSALDTNGSVTGAYRARTLPALFFVGADGLIQDLVVGPLSETEIVDKIADMTKGSVVK